MSEPIDNKKKSRTIALFLAFLPSVMVLGALASRTNNKDALQAACFLSVICCFVSSFMMFARRTALAILAGVAFLILNGMISFFFGCAASLGKLS